MSNYPPGVTGTEPEIAGDPAYERFLESYECFTEAWDEARDQMPDHLTEAVLAWFVTTPRFDTVFTDWMRGDL